MHLPIVSNKEQRQKGDTLVEVLIAIAVVSLILGGAYVTTNRSLQATRAAQERSVALKLAESQMERLKGLVATSPITVFNSPSPFCINSSGSVVDAAANSQQCGLDGNGNQTSDEPIFHIEITRDSNNNFVLTEEWYNASGRNQDSLQLRYRIHE